MYTEALRTMSKDELIAHYLWKGLNLDMFKVLEILPQSGSDAAIIMKRKKGKHTPWCVEYKGSGKYFDNEADLEAYIRARKFRS